VTGLCEHQPTPRSSALRILNRYSLGSAGQWLYQYAAGIGVDPARPGFEHILIHPRPGAGLTSARAEYRSIRGPIVSEWSLADREFRLFVSIPPNTSASVAIPAAQPANVHVGDHPASAAAGVSFERMQRDRTIFAIESGSYTFTSCGAATS
jgi:alpha-L-rhamnosidase